MKNETFKRTQNANWHSQRRWNKKDEENKWIKVIRFYKKNWMEKKENTLRNTMSAIFKSSKRWKRKKGRGGRVEGGVGGGGGGGGNV